jgi:hypothetical protein
MVHVAAHLEPREARQGIFCKSNLVR